MSIPIAISWRLNQAIDNVPVLVGKECWVHWPKNNSNITEYTFYSRGSLWKVRQYKNGACKVFYGTTERVYCSDLASAIKQIPV